MDGGCEQQRCSIWLEAEAQHRAMCAFAVRPGTALAWVGRAWRERSWRDQRGIPESATERMTRGIARRCLRIARAESLAHLQRQAFNVAIAAATCHARHTLARRAAPVIGAFRSAHNPISALAVGAQGILGVPQTLRDAQFGHIFAGQYQSRMLLLQNASSDTS
jgi:hypothetical protein